MAGVMHEFKEGKLHSGTKDGPQVSNRKQAIAIGLSEQRKASPAKKSKAKSSPVSHMRTDVGHFDGRPAPAGFGSVSHKPRVLNNPKTLTGRRNASRSIAYQD